MTETSTATRIIGIDTGGMMSTIWTFTYITAEDVKGVFYADHRPARELCEGLYDYALQAAEDEGIEIPRAIKDRQGLLVTFVNVELTPNETMGMQMPNVEPVSLDVERLQKLIAEIK